MHTHFKYIPALQIHEPSNGWNARSFPAQSQTDEPADEEELLPHGLHATYNIQSTYGLHAT